MRCPLCVARFLMLAGLGCLILAGCVEREETITVHPDGRVDILAKFSSDDAEDLHDGDAVPSVGSGWAVGERVGEGGDGGSGKHDDPNAIPARAHTLSIIYLPPGQGNAAHTHEVEETFFVLQGFLDTFIEDEDGRRLTTRLGPWECVTCPPGVIHGFDNVSLEPVYFQVMLGCGKPEGVGYTDDELFEHRHDHLKSV